jgi:hypothetical protein
MLNADDLEQGVVARQRQQFPDESPQQQNPDFDFKLNVTKSNNILTHVHITSVISRVELRLAKS